MSSNQSKNSQGLGSPSPKFSILCLPGAGSNADVFETQTAPLRYQLNSGTTIFDFQFVEGTHPWPARPAIATTFGQEQAYWSYHDGSAATLDTSIDELAQYVIDNGPFDAVMGFSMGGTLAATLLIQPHDASFDREQRILARSMIRSAIFLCSAPPADPMQLKLGAIERIGPDGDEIGRKLLPVKVPTVHVWSLADKEDREGGACVVQVCNPANRVEILHSAGHAVPSQTEEVMEVAAAINKMVSTL